jgi:hypothetical protein
MQRLPYQYGKEPYHNKFNSNSNLPLVGEETRIAADTKVTIVKRQHNEGGE